MTHLACGLCECTECEKDELIQLGKMGYICVSCLENVTNNVLPLALTARQRPAARDDKPAPPCSGRVVPFPGPKKR